MMLSVMVRVIDTVTLRVTVVPPSFSSPSSFSGLKHKYVGHVLLFLTTAYWYLVEVVLMSAGGSVLQMKQSRH